MDFLFSAMFPSHSSESDEDYRPDAKEEAMLSMYEDTAVKDECLGNSSGDPLPKRLAQHSFFSVLDPPTI